MFRLWVFLLFVFHVCLCYTVLSVPCSHVIVCLERAEFLALLCVMFPCVLSLSHMVSRARCGSWLYRFLIFTFFLTLSSKTRIQTQMSEHYRSFDYFCVQIEQNLKAMFYCFLKIILFRYLSKTYIEDTHRCEKNLKYSINFT